MVLKAINLGLMCMDKKNTYEQLQNAIMDFVTCYRLLGFMTALPTTPDFITYEFYEKNLTLRRPVPFTN